MRLSSKSVFATLTYDQEHLPAYASLVKRDVQLFMKRLRKVKGDSIRYFACGEYGERTLRPHYHILLFNVEFPDRKWFKNAPSGPRLYESKELSVLWPNGHVDFAECDEGACMYVCSYMTKSLFAKKIEYLGREPEFRLMSRRPGLGHGYVDKYTGELLRNDNVVVRGKLVGIPKYYDDLLIVNDEDQMLLIKDRRRAKLQNAAARHERSLERRRIKEELDYVLLKRFAREI